MIHGGNVWQGNGPAQWLDYSANLRPEGMPGWVRTALAKGMEHAAYYPDPEMKRARSAMAEYLQLPEDCVQPTAGGISAIRLANRLPSRETLIFTPCFCEYEQFAMSPVRRVSLIRERHVIGMPGDVQIGENSLVWLCNPLNPAGAAFTLEQIERLLGRVEASKGWLIVDEAFIEYCPQHSAAGLVERHERLVITGSMTKILGIPGVRLGYLCARKRVLDELKKHQLTWELSCFAEAVACALPEHRAEIMRDGWMNARRRERLKAALEELGVFVYPSEAAFLLADFARPAAAIAEKLKAKNILTRSCMNFDGLDDGCHLRLAVKDEASNEKLIDALKEVLLCAENL